MARRHIPMSTYPPLPDFDAMDDVALVTYAGEALFGAHWRRYLPERMGVSESYLEALTRKKEAKPLTPTMRGKLADLCLAEPERIMEMSRWQISVMRGIHVAIEKRRHSDD